MADAMKKAEAETAGKTQNMNDQSPSTYRTSCIFPTSASAILHNFVAHAAKASIVLPLMAGAAAGPGAAHLPELEVDIVVDWPRNVTRQAARAQSTLTGRHLLLMAMRSPLVADDYEVTLVNNDAGTITFLDNLQLFRVGTHNHHVTAAAR